MIVQGHSWKLYSIKALRLEETNAALSKEECLGDPLLFPLYPFPSDFFLFFSICTFLTKLSDEKVKNTLGSVHIGCNIPN